MGANNNPFWQSSGGASLISGAGALGSGLFGGLFAGSAQKRQYKYNKRLQEQQQVWQKYMWDLQNMYNLPINEVQRLLDAGINPALAFSNGGASAAPVPMSGSAGGVSAPTAEMPNVGASALSAAQAQQRVENETKVADSQAEKNLAEAEEARKNAGLSGTRQEFEAFRLGIEEEVRNLTISDRKLGNYMRQLDAASGFNDYVRGDILTANYPQLLGQEIEKNRANISQMRASVDEMEAHVSLMQKQGRLTDDEARSVRQTISIRAFDAMLADFKARALSDAMDTQYQGDDGNWHGMVDKFTQTLRNEFETRLRQSETGYIEAGLDLDFQREYGAPYRELQYEGLRRNVNSTRTRQWTGVINSISGLGMMAAGGVSAGANMRHVKALQQHWQSTANRFGSSMHYSGGNTIMPPVYSPYGYFGEY